MPFPGGNTHAVGHGLNIDQRLTVFFEHQIGQRFVRQRQTRGQCLFAEIAQIEMNTAFVQIGNAVAAVQKFHYPAFDLKRFELQGEIFAKACRQAVQTLAAEIQGHRAGSADF